jgi:hypothetical protein
MARTPKNVQANPHVTSPAVVDLSVDLETEPSGQSVAGLPDPVDAPLEGEEHKLAEDAADAAGIGSAHGDSSDASVSLVEMVHVDELHPDEAELLELGIKLAELGDPEQERREAAARTNAIREQMKQYEQGFRKSLSAAQDEERAAFQRSLDLGPKIAQLKADIQKVQARIESAAAAPAPMPGDSA